MTARQRAMAVARGLLDRTPERARTRIRSSVYVVRGLPQLKRNQALLALRVARLEEAASTPAPVGPALAEPPFPAGVRSRLCTQSQFREPWFSTWCELLGDRPLANRKLWERAYIAHVLDLLGLLRPGTRGIGFGVGREPLAALFARRGCEIVATDLPPSAPEVRVWRNSGQYPPAVARAAGDGRGHPDDLGGLLRWRAVDMRAIPDDLTGFDFCWSACALEHLGSLGAGMDFVERSLSTLKSGGIAVHTTEYNVTSDDRTLTDGPTVLYRRRDVTALVDRLASGGHQVAAIDLDHGDGVLDQYVDVPPYAREPHIRVRCGPFVTTSLALVIRSAG